MRGGAAEAGRSTEAALANVLLRHSASSRRSNSHSSGAVSERCRRLRRALGGPAPNILITHALSAPSEGLHAEVRTLSKLSKVLHTDFKVSGPSRTRTESLMLLCFLREFESFYSHQRLFMLTVISETSGTLYSVLSKAPHAEFVNLVILKNLLSTTERLHGDLGLHGFVNSACVRSPQPSAFIHDQKSLMLTLC